MIQELRLIIFKRDWKVSTRSCGSAITIDNEIVTTFRRSKNARKTWTLIKEGSNERLRQIAWVEIAFNKDQFIYLAEMELKESETGKSTLCIIPKELHYMFESDFKTLLDMTAVKNRWPKNNHHWKTDKARNAAEKYFDNFTVCGIGHPTELSGKTQISPAILRKWAKHIEAKLLKLVETV